MIISVIVSKQPKNLNFAGYIRCNGIFIGRVMLQKNAFI